MPTVFKVQWHEDGSATVLGRITARNGSGSATGIAGEGNWLEQADISTITCAVYDRAGSAVGKTVTGVLEINGHSRISRGGSKV